MDVIANRDLLVKVRDFARKIPLVWPSYRIYHRYRRWREAQRFYPEAHLMTDFGQFEQPSLEHPASQLCTSEQMLTPVYEAWCDAMHSPARFSRKQWEFVYILQALSLGGMLVPGKRGLGFGCGREPLVGVLANSGASVLATDLNPEDAQRQGWATTGQHTSSIDMLYDCAREFISRNDFYQRVEYQTVDMNAVPEAFDDSFDFVWSACALEHLGSLQHGLDFIRNSVRCLRAGGIAVHTTEFNLSSTEETFESPGCSIYREKDIRQLIAQLTEDGYQVEPLNLNTGGGNVDRYVDAPPYAMSPHLKLELEGYIVTSIGLIIRKPEGHDGSFTSC